MTISQAYTHASPGALKIEYIPASQVGDLDRDPRVLAGFRFGRDCVAVPMESDRLQLLGLGFPQLGHEPQVEVWRTDSDVRYRLEHGFALAECDDLLVGWTVQDADDEVLRQNGEDIYRRVGEILKRAGFPYLQRMWNYLPRINQLDHDGLERYRSFCFGRHEGMFGFLPGPGELPAASGVGVLHGELSVYFIAARAPGIQIENPRQVSAYCYPSRYGPRSPSFARATVVGNGGNQGIFISGTASIVGHESLHENDLSEQVDETLRNIEALLASARKKCPGIGAPGAPDLDQLKVYIRNPRDVAVVAKQLEHWAPGVPLILLQGDICRAELLVEIESSFGFA